MVASVIHKKEMLRNLFENNIFHEFAHRISRNGNLSINCSLGIRADWPGIDGMFLQPGTYLP